MPDPILQTKIFIPKSRHDLVSRQRLFTKLNTAKDSKLTLISAPAGFGKTTLASEWVAVSERPAAWVALDDGDNDPIRFLSYIIAALQTISPNFGEGVLSTLQSPQPPPTESILTTLLNEITAIPDDFVLVLDDYHVIDSSPVNDTLTSLLEHLPPQMHLVIATREDPNLPLARLRGRGQLAELRVTDLRFTSSEAAEYLNQAEGLTLSTENIAGLETRTEGWITGLQLAAISMQGHKDIDGFIKSFSGSNKFVLDYLVEEVLLLQSERVRTFLLQTSILSRLCGSLCEAVLPETAESGQETLEYIDQNNLFIVPLDNERRWFRYHHLFADLLRKRLNQSTGSFSGSNKVPSVAELHIRASEWYENNDLEIEAFKHAAAANDIERAERLVEGNGMLLHFRGAGTYVLKWLEALPLIDLDERPSLWVMYASTLMLVGQHTAVEQKLQTAEVLLQEAESDDVNGDLLGRIASIRATLAVIQNDVETIIAQSLRAQKYLHSENLIFRTIATWTLGFAYQLKGDRVAASQAYIKTINIGEDSFYTIAATITLAQIHESDIQLILASTTYQSGLLLAGDPPHMIACEAYLGLARIYYEWNELDTAQQYGQQSLQLIQQMENVDSFASYGVFLARLMLARGDLPGAVEVLGEAEEFVHQHNFEFRMPKVAETQVLTLLYQGDLAAAGSLAQKYDLPLSQARVHLGQGESSAALTILDPLHQQMDTKGWKDEQLRILILQAMAHYALGNKSKAVQLLAETLSLAESENFIRIFVDEGLPMELLLSEAISQGMSSDYMKKILAVIKAGKQKSISPCTQLLISPLSERELEIMTLIASGQKNKEIGEQLFISLNTVLFHIKNIYSKLGVNKRTLAIIKARELNILSD